MESTDYYYLKNDDGKIFIPCCSICLEPFETYDTVLADKKENIDPKEDDLYHRRCLKPYNIISFCKAHREAYKENGL